jgi:hypothetical protein
MKVKTKALGIQLDTTTCNRLMVVPSMLTRKHWLLSVAQKLQQVDSCAMKFKRKALGTQLGTTT